MDPNLDGRLKAIEAKMNDTYRMVVKLRGAQRAATAMRIAYWIFLVLLGLGAFYFVQPYLTQLKDTYGFGTDTDSQSVNDIIQQFKSLQDS